MCWPLPEQARSHRGSVADAESVFGSDQNCRSEPAREGGGSGTGDGECTGLFAGKPAPTGDSRRTWNLRSTAIQTVGASLLAKAVCQSPVMVNVPASSRAGSVLQGFVVDAESVFGSDQTVGAGLPANAVYQSPMMVNVPASSRAGSVLQRICGGCSICVRQRSKL